MIKISKIKEDYYEASGKLSDIVRQLDFSGIAIYWLIRVGKDTGGLTYSPFLRWPLALFIASLTFDLLHYIYKSAMLGISNTYYFHKNNKNEQKEVHWSGKRNWPTLFFFWGKSLFAIAAYLLLLKYMWQQLSQN